MEFLFWLLVAHFVGDFALQSQFMAETKSKLPLVMIAHVIIWTGIIMIPVKLFGYNIFPAALVMALAHWFVDFMKMKLFDKLKDKKGKEAIMLFNADQVMHFIQILVLWRAL